VAFAGIPEAWKQILLIITALAIGYTAYSEEVKVFFMPRINHDAVAADAFSPLVQGPDSSTHA
jgi:hypothetical protein